MMMMNKFFLPVKLVTQYHLCQWNGKLVNRLYVVSRIYRKVACDVTHFAPKKVAGQRW